jgi:hypothetical protein
MKMDLRTNNDGVRHTERSCSKTSSSVGDKTITATFEDKLAFNDSSDTVSHTVCDKINATLAIDGFDTDSSVIGQSNTVIGIIHEWGSGDPTGSVDVDEGEARFLIRVGIDTGFQGQHLHRVLSLAVLAVCAGAQGGSG